MLWPVGSINVSQSYMAVLYAAIQYEGGQHLLLDLITLLGTRWSLEVTQLSLASPSCSTYSWLLQIQFRWLIRLNTNWIPLIWGRDKQRAKLESAVAVLQCLSAEERLLGKRVSPAGCRLAGTMAGQHHTSFSSLYSKPHMKTQGRQRVLERNWLH